MTEGNDHVPSVTTISDLVNTFEGTLCIAEKHKQKKPILNTDVDLETSCSRK